MAFTSYSALDYQPVLRKAVLKNLGKGKARQGGSFTTRIKIGSASVSHRAQIHFIEQFTLTASARIASTWAYGITTGIFQFDSPPLPAPRLEYIATLGHPVVTLRKPIPVTVEEVEGVFSAWSSDIRVFGYGPTEIDAIEDFKSAVVESYEALVEDSEKLGPSPASTLISLREFIAEKP